MGRGPGRWLTKEIESPFWRRWKAGETLGSIAAAMDQYTVTLFDVVKQHGGIVPRERCRSLRSLSLAEREEISRGLCEGRSIRVIARKMGRAPSSVSREISRNCVYRACYRAHVAEKRAWNRALRPARGAHSPAHRLAARVDASRFVGNQRELLSRADLRHQQGEQQARKTHGRSSCYSRAGQCANPVVAAPVAVTWARAAAIAKAPMRA